ncbi:MAG: hypothetical protein KJ066_16640 [Acidobacteria bacterium]|nr:hypothetical protein [Acidobacteriota bacterium]
MAPAKLQPALLGGIFIGVLSGLPVVSLCCCLWMIGGGALAAYLMQQNHPTPVSPGDGALVGLLAGVVSAFVYVLVTMLANVLVGPAMDGVIEQLLDGTADLPPEARDVLERVRGMGVGGVVLVFSFVFQLFLGTVFATLGGLLGAVLFRKPSPPIAPPPLPPSFTAPSGPGGPTSV